MHESDLFIFRVSQASCIFFAAHANRVERETFVDHWISSYSLVCIKEDTMSIRVGVILDLKDSYFGYLHARTVNGVNIAVHANCRGWTLTTNSTVPIHCRQP